MTACGPSPTYDGSDLRPGTPSSRGRYDKFCNPLVASQHCHSRIAPGFGFGDPSLDPVAEDPLPPHWSRHNTEDLDLRHFISSAHLKVQLEHCYWEHVEQFPMHFGLTGFGHEFLDELVCVLAHARLHQLTSRDSTSGFSAERCAELLQILDSSKDHVTSDHIICLCARAWSMIMWQRFQDFYGDENCRISRYQAVLDDPVLTFRLISVVASWVSFNISRDYLLKLDRVFFDNIVYQIEWMSMIRDCISDWTDALRGATVLLLLHVFLLFLDSNKEAAVISAALSAASFVAAKILIHCYTPLQRMPARDAQDYLQSIQSPTFKFQFVALVFALPRALQFWGLLALLCNCALMFTRHFGHVAAIAVAAVSALVVLVFLWTTSASFNYRLTRISTYLSMRAIMFKAKVSEKWARFQSFTISFYFTRSNSGVGWMDEYSEKSESTRLLAEIPPDSYSSEKSLEWVV
ncbi:hypothetical protein B0H17DRAFT_1330943 [Mycena rosella]|uniref:Uncharacterized protein n=1 Tax=Mycena rosella TaxID=1033263 RepID=A0AAD7GJG6_MYCRO|nr:hypothetical protein B0H17DRAFT_1330943 [Mycena rosella]